MYDKTFKTEVEYFDLPGGIVTAPSPIKVELNYNQEYPSCKVVFDAPFLDENRTLKMKCLPSDGRSVFMSYIIKYSDETEETRNTVGFVNDNDEINLIKIRPRHKEPYITNIEINVYDEQN